MKIKKYIGNSTHEAMLKLKMELGPDAVILTTKTIRHKGIMGFFRKPLVEITAAFEEKDLMGKNTNRKYENKLNNINEEIVELKSLIMNISEKRIEEDKTRSFDLEYINETMIENGVHPNIAKEVMVKIGNKIDLNNKNRETIKKIVEFNLSEILGDSEPIKVDKERKIIFLVGPTGVGKTTTLAKIAANFVLKENYDIGLITSDTYRIAAIEQLRIYSDILQLPLEIAYNKDDIINAINNFQDKDVILVDTAGRNHNDPSQLYDLKEVLNAVDQKDVFLLISATTDYKVLETIMEKYSFLDEYKLIITKIDEAENYGNIFNIRYMTNKELSYFTTGQNVPDDIQVIDVKEIAKKLVEESIHD